MQKINDRINAILTDHLNIIDQSYQQQFNKPALNVSAQTYVEYRFSNLFKDIKRYKKQSYCKKKNFTVYQKASVLLSIFCNSESLADEEKELIYNYKIDLLPEDVNDNLEKFINHYIKVLNNIIISKREILNMKLKKVRNS